MAGARDEDQRTGIACVHRLGGDALADFGQTLDRITHADAVIFDGSCEQGFAAGAEAMFARMHGTPVIAVCPDDSPYRDARHHFAPDPFLLGLCDHVARSMTEARAWAQAAMRAVRPPRASAPERAIAYFRELTG